MGVCCCNKAATLSFGANPTTKAVACLTESPKGAYLFVYLLIYYLFWPEILFKVFPVNNQKVEVSFHVEKSQVGVYFQSGALAFHPSRQQLQQFIVCEVSGPQVAS